jgi:mono/diheme cytochrome c family protein
MLAIATSAVLAAGDGKAPRRSLYPSQFPPGPGKELADRNCVICHSASMITQQAKDSTGWEKTLAQMEKWAGAAAPAEHDSLRNYLLAHFGPKKK